MYTKISDFKKSQLNESFGSNYTNHPMSNHVITVDDAKALYALEERDLGLNGDNLDMDFNEFCEDIVGETLSNYATWRWPDEPQQQFDMALEVLGNRMHESKKIIVEALDRTQVFRPSIGMTVEDIAENLYEIIQDEYSSENDISGVNAIISKLTPEICQYYVDTAIYEGGDDDDEEYSRIYNVKLEILKELGIDVED